MNTTHTASYPRKLTNRHQQLCKNLKSCFITRAASSIQVTTTVQVTSLHVLPRQFKSPQQFRLHRYTCCLVSSSHHSSSGYIVTRGASSVQVTRAVHVTSLHVLPRQFKSPQQFRLCIFQKSCPCVTRHIYCRHN